MIDRKQFGVDPHRILFALAAVCSFVLVGATTLGFLARFHWFADLFSNFRVQYAGGFLVTFMILLALKRFRWAAALAPFLAANLLVIGPLYVGGTNEDMGGKPTTRAMLFNVNTDHGQPALVQSAIQRYDPDILVLEEVDDSWIEHLEEALTNWPYRIVELRSDNFGIGIFSRFPLGEVSIEYFGDAGVPSISADVEFGGRKIRLIATHPVPPVNSELAGFRNRHLDQLGQYADNFSAPVLLLGDLNASPWSPHFRRLLSSSGLKDSTKGFGVQPTWPSDKFLLRVPIDHALHSAEIAIVDRQVGDYAGSDHFPLILDFFVEESP